MAASLRDRLAALAPDQRADVIARMDPDTLALLLANDWSVVARPEQLLPPDDEDWFACFWRAGRGWGKTLTGSNGTVEGVQRLWGRGVEHARWALVAPRREDVKSIMLEGETGLRSVIPPSLIPKGWEQHLNKSSLTLTLVDGHRVATLQGFSGQKPDALRGPQHHGAWVDEPATLPDAHLGLDEDTTMSNLLFGLRLPPIPRLLITGTPRNNRLVRSLLGMANLIERRGSTRENLQNLAAAFRENVVARYAGTRLGRQELDAELLEGVGVLFQRGWFPLIPESPADAGWRRVRTWDLAATEPGDTNPDPDFTATARVAYHPDSRVYVIEHVARFRANPGARDDRIRDTAIADGPAVPVWVEQEPGSAGKSVVHSLGKHLDGVARVRGFLPSGPKEVRAELVAGAAQQGRVTLVDGPWVLDVLDELEEFPNAAHDDQVDALSMAFATVRDSAPAATVHNPAKAPDLPRVPRGRNGSPSPALRSIGRPR